MGNFRDAITIRYTLAEADPAHLLTKRIWIGDNGSLAKQSAACPLRGVFTDIAHCGTAEDILNDYANVLRSLSSRQAIIAAPLPSPSCNDGRKWRLKSDTSRSSASTMTRSGFSFRMRWWWHRMPTIYSGWNERA